MAAEMERAERARWSVTARTIIDVDPESYRFGEACRGARPFASRARALAAWFLGQYATLAPPDPSVDQRLGARLDLHA